MRQLFGAYLHQDWNVDFETPGVAISAFIRDAGSGASSRMEDLARDIREFVREHPDDDELTTALGKELWCEYFPPGDGHSTREWLEEVAKRLELDQDRPLLHSRGKAGVRGRMVTIIAEYVAGMGQLERQVRDLGLDRRMAFVLDTVRQGEEHLPFDPKLYIALLHAARDAFQADRLVALSSTGETTELAGATDRVRLTKGEAEIPREPPEQVLLYREGRIVAAIGSEPWVRVGGPDPSHDSYTIPISSAEDRTMELKAAARAAFGELGAFVTESNRAGGRPPRPSGFLRSLLSRFGRERGRRLSSSAELYRFLLELEETLKRQGDRDLAEEVKSASRHAAGMSTEFLGESRNALRDVLDRGANLLNEEERRKVADVLKQLDEAFDRRR